MRWKRGRGHKAADAGREKAMGTVVHRLLMSAWSDLQVQTWFGPKVCPRSLSQALNAVLLGPWSLWVAWFWRTHVFVEANP